MQSFQLSLKYQMSLKWKMLCYCTCIRYIINQSMGRQVMTFLGSFKKVGNYRGELYHCKIRAENWYAVLWA